MKIKRKRLLAVLLLAAMIIGVIPTVMATEELPVTDVGSSVEAAEDSGAEQETPEEPQISPPVQSDAVDDDSGQEAEESEEQEEKQQSEDGQSLTRDEGLLATAQSGIMLASAASTATVSKSTCVDVSLYQSPTWYCNRYCVSFSEWQRSILHRAEHILREWSDLHQL